MKKSTHKSPLNTIRFFVTVFMVFLSISTSLLANNIQVTNISLGTNDYVNKTLEVNFDLSWENSWRTSTLESNWDAAWIILKYKIEDPDNYNYYSHANLNATGHTAASGSVLDLANGLQGAMIHRDADGIGNVSFTGITLLWDYGQDYLGGFEALDVQVIATEMVYIPGGAFFVGDASPTTEGRLGDGSGIPFQITSEATITLGGGGINLNSFWSGANGDDFDAIATQTLPADFPKGFDPFYIMKYEISIDQYLNFLNTTSNFEIGSYYFNPPFTGPEQIIVNYGGTSPYLEYDYSTQKDGSNVYSEESQSNSRELSDWYGLRIMTELEFEKASRGPLNPIANEYVWGDQSITYQSYLYNGSDNVDNSGTGNAIFAGTFQMTQNIYYPDVKVGYFAAQSVVSSRQLTGSSYYGVQGLSGSNSETIISIGSSTGRNFNKNLNGDGDLATPLLQQISLSEKGGYFNADKNLLKTSTREYYGSGYINTRMVISDF